MKKTKLLILSILSLLFVFTAGQAFALTILDNLQTGNNTVSDQDREYLIDRGGDSTTLDIGDSFRGSINFNTVNSGAANQGGTSGNYEWSGVFQVRLADIDTTFGPAGTPGAVYIWEPDPALWTPASGYYDPNAAVGSIAVLYEDPSNNYAADFTDPTAGGLPVLDDGTVAPRTVPPSSADVGTGANTTEEAFIATATDGTYWGSIGFDGSGDTYGFASIGAGFTGSNDVLNSFGISSATQFASSNFFLNLLDMNPIYAVNLQINRVKSNNVGGFVDFTLSQGLKGVNDLDTPFEVSSNTDVAFNATVVPEPGTFVLFGISLLGLAGAARRKQA
jgi:hypothetical protein